LCNKAFCLSFADEQRLRRGGDWFRAGAKFSTIIPEDIPSVGFNQQMIVREALSEELVYRLTKLWWERVKEIEEIAPIFTPSDPKKALEGATIPVHPGALRYYKEIGVVS
jgi:TRAP-type uncharacterized transport system substrate-binding protein